MSHPSASEIRRGFLDFFAAREHREVPSSPVFPMDDPTLLFTNAGMNQFKDVFLGTGSRNYTRAVDTQKCIRVSGKHNDLEEVGVDSYHHTFFEMLGNWSFGDYFKEDAIVWSWELLTDVWKLPKERLWVTVFGGGEKEGLPADEDTERLWLEKTDIDPGRVLRFDKRDNFWEMGETGPCGPCSEIHIDRGGPDRGPFDGADPKIGVNAGNERFIELWNLVFMEFNRVDDGTLKSLPAKHVDTGMGFERIVSVLQGKSSNYDTDIFRPIFRGIEELVGCRYGATQSEQDIAFRVIADHVRAVSSAFADGALPSNLGRGYVLRRLIRRASRYGRQALGCADPFLHRVVPFVAETLGGAFPEIRQRIDHIQLLIRSEEESFSKTLGKGLTRFGQLAEKVSGKAGGALPGDEAFELYATYGFPKDLIELMAREHELALDDEGWRIAEESHQERSRSVGKFKQLLSTEELGRVEACFATRSLAAATESTCHEAGERGVRIETELIHIEPGEDEGPGGDRARLILRESPFYAESGGQIGDRGIITDRDGRFRMVVEDTRRFGDLIVHVGAWEGPLPGRSETVTVVAEVDGERRSRTRKNHTATHLLHRALRQVLGEHVNQQGSYVGPDRLRFDFSHPRAMTAEEVSEVETLVNRQVIENAPVRTTEEELSKAKARGVMALFGEKYADRVRVVDVGGFSTELCGGTHVRAAGDIGPFVLISESAIQAGVRRVEALSGPDAVCWIQNQKRLLAAAARALKSAPEEVPERIADLQKRLKKARKKEKQSSSADVSSALEAVREELSDHEGVLCGMILVDLNLAGLRELAGRVKGLGSGVAAVLVGCDGDRAPWIALAEGTAREKGYDAKHLAILMQKHLGGGGGGKPELSQGQGQKASGREAVLEAFRADSQGAFGVC